jgi:hypothetical protein
VTYFEVAIPFSGATVSAGWELEGHSLCYNANPGPGEGCMAQAAFSADITGAEVLNSSNNVVSGAIVLSESGFNPNASPEPGTFVLFGSALVLAAFLRRSFESRQPRD